MDVTYPPKFNMVKSINSFCKYLHDLLENKQQYETLDN